MMIMTHFRRRSAASRQLSPEISSGFLPRGEKGADAAGLRVFFLGFFTSFSCYLGREHDESEVSSPPFSCHLAKYRKKYRVISRPARSNNCRVGVATSRQVLQRPASEALVYQLPTECERCPSPTIPKQMRRPDPRVPSSIHLDTLARSAGAMFVRGGAL